LSRKRAWVQDLQWLSTSSLHLLALGTDLKITERPVLKPFSYTYSPRVGVKIRGLRQEGSWAWPCLMTPSSKSQFSVIVWWILLLKKDNLQKNISLFYKTMSPFFDHFPQKKELLIRRCRRGRFICLVDWRDLMLTYMHMWVGLKDPSPS